MNTPVLCRTRFGRRFPVFAIVVILTATASVPAERPLAPADTVVVVVSAASTVTEISRLHLADLYMGRTTRFPNGMPAVPIDQRPGSAERAVFTETYLGRSEAQIKAYWSKIIFTGRGRPPAEASSGEAVLTIVAADPRAIGYLDRRLVNSTVRIVNVQ
jgi:ABC-type phosphate transport system substrate-binding protein